MAFGRAHRCPATAQALLSAADFHDSLLAGSRQGCWSAAARPMPVRANGRAHRGKPLGQFGADGVLREPDEYPFVETNQRRDFGEYEPETRMPTMTVSGRTYDVDSGSVQEALQGVLPEPIHEHFVVINGRRWPPKQVLALVTGLDRADFTTHQARRALTRLGFTAPRSARPTQRHAMGASAAAPSRPAAAESATPAQPLVEAL